ncbi:MAG: 7-carboxy-7-deazaguanine synthase QueE [Proteobacteria bacterium]|nr:7-carboxy-7-deazaguanine synthase QueE [Pseudomonadota bacterium]
MTLTLATISAGEPEIFAALQGEGISAGLPCAFIRLSRCNLACRWCDTAYTWRFAGDNRPHVDGVDFAREANQVVLEVAEAARRIVALGQNRLVITGGEPLLQGAALARLVALLPGVAVEVETNGTVPPHPALDPLVAQYNVSPKLAHSGNAAQLALVPERLAAWANEPRAWFKFVVASPEDVAEVAELARAHALPAARIRLMPEGRDAATLRARMAWLAPLCLNHGFGLSDRLHIHLSGDTRGT